MSASIWSFVTITMAIVAMIAAHMAQRAADKAMRLASLAIERVSSSRSFRLEDSCEARFSSLSRSHSFAWGTFKAKILYWFAERARRTASSPSDSNSAKCASLSSSDMLTITSRPRCSNIRSRESACNLEEVEQELDQHGRRCQLGLQLRRILGQAESQQLSRIPLSPIDDNRVEIFLIPPQRRAGVFQHTRGLILTFEAPTKR